MYPSFYWILLTAFSASVLQVKGDPESFNEKAQNLLKRNLLKTENRNVARNVIIVVGDGMSLATVAAARVLKGQKAGRPGVGEEMLYETFPSVGLARTYATDKYVPDSASTATAFLCGVKTKYEGVGVDDSILHADCSSVPGTEVRCIGEWAIAEGKAVGLVTNMRVTHATPAPLYAHAANRWWESDANFKTEKERALCKDIARQLVEDYPGKNLQVILGGGREALMPNTTFDPEYPEKRGKRGDHRQLIETWKKHKEEGKHRYRYVWNKKDFNKVDPRKTDYLLGLFEPAHLYDVTDRGDQKSDFDEPTLAEMTEKAIRILSRNSRGFFLLVEGGLIDKRHHSGKAVRAVSEALDLENAVRKALELTSREDTLLIVTSDHSQGMNFAGYANVGEDIFGFADISNVDGMPYTTLMYSSGPGYKISATGRENITGVNTAHKDYLQQATVPRSTATHGGEDVGVYAIGPMAHLFTGVYDQNYIAHAMAYAACIGRNKDHCQGMSPSGAQRPGVWRWWTQMTLVLMIAALY
ncbi:alkaline phosphatase, tissue-nonspecific isozyme [Trichonephila inaurata madagascariensis]|uniref:Alkaline phosphatase n=1 Tax=Trichonephila inaurata madagascariensis TaxID=2747483 RepID=A0A8X6MBI3_9ARAC|nr:alkaline phosphatase, tissue-nonspecific isozyme [Trichonephila inaurata madagascariensis]